MSKFDALRKGDRLDFVMADAPKCPHCGSDYDIAENEAWRLYDQGDSHEVECPSCDGKFMVVPYAKWSFSTDEQEDDE